MYAERKFINVGALAAQIKYSNLRVGHTAVESGLGVWLSR